jgi:integrase
MRNPNGYGSVIKLSGNRRNPFMARKTEGFNEKSHPIYKIIGYYPTRDAAMIALAEYNRQPYNVATRATTFQELYNLWIDKKATKINKSSYCSLKSAYAHCSSIYGMKYREIRSYHMQDIIDNCGRGYSTQGAIKNLFGHLDRFALELDVVDKCYAHLTTAASIPETSKTPFTDEEIKKVWQLKNIPWADSIIFLLYTGFRISEMLELRTENIDLAAGTIKGGLKTKAGRDRIIPINSKIIEIVKKRMKNGGEYLFSVNFHGISKGEYYVFWREIMKILQTEHTPHECRHTFRSRLDSAGANKRCIDLIMGHKSTDVGERVYTHKTIGELKETIELIS